VRIASLLIVLIGLIWPRLGLAEQWVAEQEATVPFQVAAQSQIGLTVLPYDSPAGFAFTSVLPPSTTGLDVVEFKWPKSDLTCQLGIAQTSQGYGQQFTMPATYLAVRVAEGSAKVIPGSEQGLPGVVARVCVWATQMNSEAQLVFLYTCSEGPDDSEVRGFIVSPDGAVTALDTQHAQTLYGWFECGDLNSDGTYELVTSRSLDASPGGFFYHAVRTYDAARQGYVPQPDLFKEYFSKELAWLDWVLSTKDLIQANPQDYMSKQEYGHIYTADYEGMTYGFDTIIELPKTFTQVPDIDGYNKQRREAYRLIKTYHDELAGWLAGTGGYPAAWKLTHE
jgi:hypothetical protein